MALVQHADHAIHAPRSSFLYVLARDFKWALRAACLLLLLGTAVFMIVFFYAAIPLGIMLALCYTLLLVAEGVEHRVEHAPAARPAADPEQEVHEDASEPATPEAARTVQRTAAIERRLTRISLEVLGGALVIAAALGAAFFGWRVLPIAALVLLGYAILVTAPVWLAWMEDDVEEEVRGQRRPL